MLDENARYFLIDTETSGLPPNAGVCEVGWIQLNAQAEIIDQVESLIDPECPISPSASGVHGIVDEDVQDSPTLSEFFSMSEPGCYGLSLEGAPVVLIGHRISFDRGFIEPHVSKQSDILELCTLRWLRNLYPHMDNHKLATARYALNLRRDAGPAHRVMADVMVTYDLLLHIMQRLNCTLPELVELSQKPMLVALCPFGKHKGQPFSEIPRSYLNWARNNLHDLDTDTAFTIRYWLGDKGEKQ